MHLQCQIQKRQWFCGIGRRFLDISGTVLGAGASDDAFQEWYRVVLRGGSRNHVRGDLGYTTCRTGSQGGLTFIGPVDTKNMCQARGRSWVEVALSVTLDPGLGSFSCVVTPLTSNCVPYFRAPEISHPLAPYGVSMLLDGDVTIHAPGHLVLKVTAFGLHAMGNIVRMASGLVLRGLALVPNRNTHGKASAASLEKKNDKATIPFFFWE